MSNITVGFRTNIQDRAVISTVSVLESAFPADVEIGNDVSY
jgi:carbonic anhydrase/acetyltransferase-like protein (isoleucine patch superfamily)